MNSARLFLFHCDAGSRGYVFKAGTTNCFGRNIFKMQSWCLSDLWERWTNSTKSSWEILTRSCIEKSYHQNPSCHHSLIGHNECYPVAIPALGTQVTPSPAGDLSISSCAQFPGRLHVQHRCHSVPGLFLWSLWERGQPPYKKLKRMTKNEVHLEQERAMLKVQPRVWSLCRESFLVSLYVAKVAYSMAFGWKTLEGLSARLMWLMLLNLFGTF